MTEPTGAAQLFCPLCRGTEFDRHEARQDTRWGITSHRILMMVCRRCSYILHFYRHRSIFDFD
jgi:predicted nucleic-acid-binding Zn-ribbon protein